MEGRGEHIIFARPDGSEAYDDDKKGYECKSDHILLKHVPDLYQKAPTTRISERLDAVRALCGNFRFISFRYLYGDSKE